MKNMKLIALFLTAFTGTAMAGHPYSYGGGMNAKAAQLQHATFTLKRKAHRVRANHIAYRAGNLIRTVGHFRRGLRFNRSRYAVRNKFRMIKWRVMHLNRSVNRMRRPLARHILRRKLRGVNASFAQLRFRVNRYTSRGFRRYYGYGHPRYYRR